MATDCRSSLRNNDLLLLDGGLGSELRRRGAALDPAAWSGPSTRTYPSLLQQIHVDYIGAGADIITTNTFASSRFVLAAAGLEREFDRINRLALEAARASRAESPRNVPIAGSISCLPPRFDVRAYPDPRTEQMAYHELADLLADGGADLLLLEMMEDTRHARWAVTAARATGLPVVLGLSLRFASDPCAGLVAFYFPETPLAALLDALLPLEPTVVAVMHTPVAAVGPALETVRRAWGGPLGAYPTLQDADASELATRRSEMLTPDELVAVAQNWVRQGARLLGGCCGSTPAHIRALDAARSSLRAARADLSARGA